MDIRGLLRSSFNEWEGRLSAVLFTANCNWRCPYCHGRIMVLEPESLPPVTHAEFFAFLKERRDWLDGVVITGGEPTLQPDLVDFIREVKFYKPVKLETNGTHPEVIKTLLDEKLLDCLCLDYKAPLDVRLMELTQVSESAAAVEKVRASFELARAATGIEREFHTTLCPAYIDEPVLREVGRDLHCPEALWVLQQYETGAPMLDALRAGSRRFSTEELDDLEQAARQMHKRILMRRGVQ